MPKRDQLTFLSMFNYQTIFESAGPPEDRVLCPRPNKRLSPNSPSADNLLWFHLCAINPKTRQWLEAETDIDQTMIEAMG
jgi:hypothetical protein